MTNSLYISRSKQLLNINKPEVNFWGSITQMVGLNLSMVDRTGYLTMPFNYSLYKEFEMPRVSTNTKNYNYEDCCNQRANEIINLSKSKNVPIRVLYSGGIDSTLVLISLMKCLDEREYYDRIHVMLSIDSINENPSFYYNTIRKKFKIYSSDNFGNSVNRDGIIVGGEHNDQLFGSDMIGKIYRSYEFDKIHDKYSRQFIVGWFVKNGINLNFANKWYDLLDQQIKSVATCEVNTNFQFLWWLNFCFKWQTVFFRILTRIDKNLRPTISQELIDSHFLHFYSTNMFQLWSMMNPDKKHISDWKDYKHEAKKIIYEYTKDKDYYLNKVKIGSLYRLFVQHDSVEAITTDYKFITECDFNPEYYYNPKNSFL